MKVSSFSNSGARRWRKSLLVAVPAVAALMLTACAGGSGGSSNGDGSGETTDNAAGVSIVVIGGASDDVFFSSIKRGIDDAARAVQANGGAVNYLALENYDNIGPDVAQLTKTAIAQKPSAIAVPNWVPDAQDAAIREAVAADIPVIIYNAGDWESAEALGALTYIGTNEHLAGAAAGEALGEAGAKNLLCVNTVPGAQNLEARCAGAIEGIGKSGGTGEQLALPATAFGDQTAVAEAIKASLQSDPTIDGVVTAGGSDSEAGATAIGQANAADRVKLVSFNLDGPVLPRIKDGGQFAAIDQQPYAQGYYSVSALFQYVAYGVELPTKPILTGPLVIDESNVDAAITGAEIGVR